MKGYHNSCVNEYWSVVKVRMYKWIIFKTSVFIDIFLKYRRNQSYRILTFVEFTGSSLFSYLLVSYNYVTL